MSRLGSSLLACLLGLTSVEAAADPPEVLHDPGAKQHFQRAQRHFDGEQYAEAIPELKAAYALEPDPLLLYAWAQAERLAGNCARAIELYRKFLATGPTPQQARLAETNVVDCEASLGRAVPPPPPAVTPEPAAEDPKAHQPDGPPKQGPRPWHRDWLGGTLVGVGGATAVAGTIVFALGRRQGANAPDARNEQDYFEQADAARTKNTVGAAVLGAGGVILLGGVIRWATLARRQRKHGARPQVGLAIPAGGFSFTLGGRF
jgi:tetratricopeptide (TPR) repeat protein